MQLRSVLLVLFILLPISGNGYRILGLFPLPSSSHFAMFKRLMLGLAERGHVVDVLSHFPAKETHPRYNDINVVGSRPIFANNVSLSVFKNMSHYDLNMFIYTECGVNVCRDVLNHPSSVKLKNTDVSYDLVITELFGTDCFLGFAHLFKAPVVTITSSVLLPWGSDRLGNPDNPSYIPVYFLHYPNTMNLYQRMHNVVLLILTKLGYHLYSTLPSQEKAVEFFGPNLPPLEQLVRNTSLLLVNSHFSINGARPATPNFIEVGGLHIKEPKPLSAQLEKHLNSTTIYFSMGSMIQSETFPQDVLNALLKTFGKLPYPVLWKAKPADMPVSVPKNVILEPWMPQLDILCHPNVKLFVSHGGLLGTQEAVYCGTPVLGIPIFADQDSNIRRLEEKGMAVRLPFEDVDEKALLNAVNLLMYDPKYSANAQKLSNQFRDRPLSALDTAIYWVEYVIRHRGAPDLRVVGADLPWYQYYMVDAIAVCISAFYITFTVTRALLKIAMCYNDPKLQRKIKRQ